MTASRAAAYGTVASYADGMRAAVRPSSGDDHDVVCLYSFMHGLLTVMTEDRPSCWTDAERLERVRNVLAAAQQVRDELRTT